MNERQWLVYLVRCSDKSLYCGITKSLKRRLAAHNLGKGAKYTRSRRPVELVGASYNMTKSDALKLEDRIKKIPAGEKISELTKRDDKIAINLKTNLQAVNREIKALKDKVQKLIVEVEPQ